MEYTWYTLKQIAAQSIQKIHASLALSMILSRLLRFSVKPAFSPSLYLPPSYAMFASKSFNMTVRTAADLLNLDKKGDVDKKTIKVRTEQ